MDHPLTLEPEPPGKFNFVARLSLVTQVSPVVKAGKSWS